MKRTSLVVMLVLSLLFSLEAGLLAVKEAKANAFFIFTSVDPIPGTIPPIITVSSPQNNAVYNSNTVYVSFNISKPQPPMSLDAGITSVRYTLDGNRTGLYYCTHYNSNYPPGFPQFSYSKNWTLSAGTHTLLIEANGVVLPGNMSIFGMSGSARVFFTVDTTADTAINSEQNIPEFPSWIILPLTMMATLAVIVVKRRRL